MDTSREYGVWPTYVAPKSFVSELVQRPSDQINGEALAAAYMRDERASRKEAA